MLRHAGIAKITTLRITLRQTARATGLPKIDDYVDTHQIHGRAEAKYHRADELTKPAQLVEAISQDIELPVSLGSSKNLILRVVVGRTGKALSVQVLKSALPREVEAEIVKRFYAAHYQPAEINSRPVTSEMLVSIDLQ